MFYYFLWDGKIGSGPQKLADGDWMNFVTFFQKLLEYRRCLVWVQFVQKRTAP